MSPRSLSPRRASTTGPQALRRSSRGCRATRASWRAGSTSTPARSGTPPPGCWRRTRRTSRTRTCSCTRRTAARAPSPPSPPHRYVENSWAASAGDNSRRDAQHMPPRKQEGTHPPGAGSAHSTARSTTALGARARSLNPAQRQPCTRARLRTRRWPDAHASTFRRLRTTSPATLGTSLASMPVAARHSATPPPAS